MGLLASCVLQPVVLGSGLMLLLVMGQPPPMGLRVPHVQHVVQVFTLILQFVMAPKCLILAAAEIAVPASNAVGQSRALLVSGRTSVSVLELGHPMR